MQMGWHDIGATGLQMCCERATPSGKLIGTVRTAQGRRTLAVCGPDGVQHVAAATPDQIAAVESAWKEAVTCHST